MAGLSQYMSAFLDQLPIFSHHGSHFSSLSTSEEDYYRALLRQAAIDNQRAYDKNELSKIGEVTRRIAQGTGPDMDVRSKMALEMSDLLTQSGASSALKPVLNMLENSQQSFAVGGVPTSNMKEYERSKVDPGLADFLKAKHHENIAAALQIASELARTRGHDQPTEEDIVQAAHIANPAQARAVEGAKEYGKKEAEDITAKVNTFPSVLYSHKALTDQVNGMGSAIDEAQKLIEQDPNSAGLVGTINKYLPETQANQLRSKLDMLKSGVALETLSDLKKNSPTGASGFGALSEHELQVIQGLYGVAEQSNDPKVLIKTLSEIKRRLDKVQQYSMEGIKNDASWLKGVGNQVPSLYGHIEPYVNRILDNKEPSTQAPILPEPPKPEPAIRKKWGE